MLRRGRNVSLGRWTRGRTARLLTGLAVGLIAGLVIYNVTRLTGRNLFVITGGIAGVIAALVLQVYGLSAQLTEVKVTIPQLSELTFLVTKDSRDVAWKLFVETVTRVSTQRLDMEAGSIREAMTSLYGLFQTTRETLKSSQPSRPSPNGPTVEYLAITMLNRELRPFLSYWHPRLHAWEQANPNTAEARWPENVACRQDLRGVQQRLYEYAMGFAKLAGVGNAAEIIRTEFSDGRQQEN
jgi:hypothetical protein